MIIEESVLRKVLRKLIVEADIDLNVDSGFVVGRKYGSDSSSDSDSLGNTDFGDENVDVADFKSKSKFRGRSSGIDIGKVFQMSKETGMKPSAVFGIMTVESGGKPESLATNPHKISGEPSLYSTTFGIHSNIVTAKWKKAGIPMESLYDVHKKDTKSRGFFLKMMSIDKLATVSVTAFGSMQVMGAYILPLYKNEPQALLSAFAADPAGFSLKALKAWIKHPSKSKFIEYVNNDNWEAAIKLYYGDANPDYVSKASNAAKNFRKKINKYKKQTNKTKNASGQASDSWKGRLGTETARGINFHKLEDGKNNYRAGINKHTNPTVEFFLELAKPIKDGGYGIKKIITLNGDGLGPTAVTNAEAAGLTVFKNFINKDNIKSGPGFDKVKRMLKNRNTLIHCTAGADRTGAYVGRYYMDELDWDYEKAKKHTGSFGGEKPGPNYKTTRDFLKYGPSA